MHPTDIVVAAPSMPGSSLDHALLEVFLTLGSAWVLYLLVVLSVLSAALAAERVIHFLWSRDDLDALQHRLHAHLENGDLSAARTSLTASRSHAARIALRGFDALHRGAASVEEVLAGAMASERVRMDRGLGFLGTLGNNAPFVGLFGTVLGIIRAFRDLALDSTDGSAAVMSGIAEALVATAVGLLVALPAVAAFNMFQRAIKTRLAGATALSHVLLAYVKAGKE